MDFAILTPEQLRQHLQSLRRARGLTQAGLGKLLGVGQVRIANIEHDPGSVSVEQFMRLLAALEARLVVRAELQPGTLAKPAVAREKSGKAPKGVW
jgi:HTH-type transcriptional regulator / antitoxin HipB